MTPLDVTPSGAEPRAQPNKSEMTTRLASAVVMAVLALGSVVVSIWTFVALVIAAGVHRLLGMGTAACGKAGFDGIALMQSAAVAAVAVTVAVSQARSCSHCHSARARRDRTCRRLVIRHARLVAARHRLFGAPGLVPWCG